MRKRIVYGTACLFDDLDTNSDIVIRNNREDIFRECNRCVVSDDDCEVVECVIKDREPLKIRIEEIDDAEET